MGTPSNPLLSGRNTKQAPYGNHQFPIRGRQGERERKGGRRRPLAPSQKTNYRTEMVPCRKASKRKGKKTETSILGTQKTNGQPKTKKTPQNTLKSSGKPSESQQTVVTTSSLLKNQNRYLPDFRCPLKNTATDGRSVSETDAITDVVIGETRRDDDVAKKERALSNRRCCC
jgi:hypothetical protein